MLHLDAILITSLYFDSIILERNWILENEINDEIRQDYLEFIRGPFHADWIILDPTKRESALTRINGPYE